MRPIAYMGALKIVGIPWDSPQLIFPTVLMDFCSDRYRDCAYKFEVRINVRRALKQRQNTSIADNVNLKNRYTVLSIKN